MASAAEQLAANISLSTFAKATELKKRLWFTLGALVLFRLLSFVPIPGIDPRAMSAFQPDYPGSMIRQGAEGTVTVRVSIGTDGKVTGIERISATDEAFWVATQRHAMRKWRFRPATRDGVPVPGTKVLTVHFKLTDR